MGKYSHRLLGSAAAAVIALSGAGGPQIASADATGQTQTVSTNVYFPAAGCHAYAAASADRVASGAIAAWGVGALTCNNSHTRINPQGRQGSEGIWLAVSTGNGMACQSGFDAYVQPAKARASCGVGPSTGYVEAQVILFWETDGANDLFGPSPPQPPCYIDYFVGGSHPDSHVYYHCYFDLTLPLT